MHVLVVTVVHVPLDARIHHRQVRALVAAGHRVTYAAPFSGHGLALSAAGPEVSAVDVPRATGRRRLSAWRAARRVVREVPADVVLLHDPELLVATAGVATPGVIGLDVHEDLAASLTDKAWLPATLRRPVATLVRAVERLAERRRPLLLAEEGYRDRFRRQHVVVPNVPWLPPPPPPPGEDRVVYLGRVSVLRGGRELVDLGRRLREHGITLEVIGPVDAELRPQVAAAAAAGHLVAPGFVPNAEALERLGGALAGLSLLHDHANYRHSLPTKVLEYQAHGVPVVTTPLPVARRIVEASGSGVVVPFGDVSATADAVLGLRDDPGRARRLAANGRRAAEERWSWDREAAGFVEELERWAQSRPNASVASVP